MKEYQANKFDIGGATNIVKAVTGKDPDDFETIVKNYVNNSPYKKRNLFNWFLAMKKFMILPLQPVLSVKALEKYNQ